MTYTQPRLWSRPLAPLVAALAVGIGAPSSGLTLPGAWLPFTIAALLLFMAVTLFSQSMLPYFSLSPRGERVRVRGEQNQTLWQDYPGWTSLALAWAGCLLCFCLGQGLFQTALNPALPAHHVRSLPHNTPISLQGIVQADRSLHLVEIIVWNFAASSWSSGGDWQPACGTVWVSGVRESSGLEPGDRAVVRLTLWPVEDLSNPGSSGRQLALARRQIFVTGILWQHLQPVKLVSGVKFILAGCLAAAPRFLPASLGTPAATGPICLPGPAPGRSE